jgi:hypothetical protein
MNFKLVCRISVIVFLPLVYGCAHPQTVTRTELDQLKTHRREPKVSMWYYVGSKNGYHYFHHDDLGDEKKDFRISNDELSWTNTFPLTRNRDQWKALEWGISKHQ